MSRWVKHTATVVVEGDTGPVHVPVVWESDRKDTRVRLYMSPLSSTMVDERNVAMLGDYLMKVRAEISMAWRKDQQDAVVDRLVAAVSDLSPSEREQAWNFIEFLRGQGGCD